MYLTGVRLAFDVKIFCSSLGSVATGVASPQKQMEASREEDDLISAGTRRTFIVPVEGGNSGTNTGSPLLPLLLLPR